MRSRKIKRVVGDVVRIALKNGKICYAVVLPNALFAFFDYFGSEVADTQEMVENPVLFKIFVMDYAVTTGRWSIVGHIELSGDLLEPAVFFKQDALNRDKLFLYVGGEQIPATRAQCEGLERAAVWDPEHVEDRLLDHYNHVPNKWLESLRVK